MLLPLFVTLHTDCVCVYTVYIQYAYYVRVCVSCLVQLSCPVDYFSSLFNWAPSFCFSSCSSLWAETFGVVAWSCGCESVFSSSGFTITPFSTSAFSVTNRMLMPWKTQTFLCFTYSIFAPFTVNVSFPLTSDYCHQHEMCFTFLFVSRVLNIFENLKES